MERSRQLIFFFIAGLAVLIFSSPVFAQWKKVLICRSNGNGVKRGAYSGFFFNELTGFIGSAGDAGIYKTTDGGSTWLRTSFPLGYSGRIGQIFMSDFSHGWATIEEPGNLKAIFKTSDGGLTWLAAGPTGNYSCIYQTQNAVIATSRSSTNTGMISADGGMTFTGGILKGTNGIDFVDNLHGVATGYQNFMWQVTQDGGLSWSNIQPPQTTETWSVYGVKGSSIFYTAGETDQRFQGANGSSTVLRSVDYGNTWSPVSTTNFYTTGHIAGFGEMLYVQAIDDKVVNPNHFGLYRSTDKGITWQPIGGPINDADSRFIVTGCNGGVIYAFDKDSAVWKTRNGGDGQIYEPPVLPQIYGNPIVFSGSICNTSSEALEIENLYCSDDTIISAQIADTTSELFKSGALTISAMPSFPLWLAPDTKDSIRFTWQPFKLFHTDTTVTFQVIVKYYSKILGQTFDTTVTVTVHAIGDVPNETIKPPNLDFGNIPFCIPHDTSFTITNNGCDTLYLLSASANAPQQYLVLDSNGNPLSLPLAIAPSDRERLIVRLNLNTTGSYTSDLILKFRHQGIEKDSTVHIAAVITSTASFISSVADTLFNLKLTRCDTAIPFPVILSNPGCKIISVTSAKLVGVPTPDITLTGILNLPENMNNGSLVTLTVIATPKNLGTYNGTLNISYSIDGIAYDTVLSYFLSIGYGSRILSVDHDTIDLGSMKLCDTKDSAIYPQDLGCDSLLITSIGIQGNGAFTLTGSPQLNLASNQSSRIPFHFEPIGAGLITGTVTVTAIADSPAVRNVTIIAHVIPTDTMTFSIAPTHTDFYAGDTLSVLMIPQQNVHNKGLYTLQFTLTYNGDLMTLLPGAAGVEVRMANTAASAPIMGGTFKHTTATLILFGNPTLEFDSLQTALAFHFSTTLTDSISTAFNLTDIKLNGGNSIYQRCQLGILSASLDYELALRCSDSLLVRYMQLGNDLKIFTDAIYPNPISQVTNFQGHIPFRVSEAGNYGLNIFDQLGRMVDSKEMPGLLKGSYQFKIDGRSLAAGCYTYLLHEISNSASGVRGRFIIAK